MRKGQIFLALLLVSPVVLVEGCVVAAVGGGAAGTVAYIRGDMEVVEAKDIGTVYKATEKALEELGLVVSKKTKDALSAKIIARDAQDKKITIKLNATTEEMTKLSIRIGTFGSETKSRLIYQKIRDNL